MRVLKVKEELLAKLKEREAEKEKRGREAAAALVAAVSGQPKKKGLKRSDSKPGEKTEAEKVRVFRVTHFSYLRQNINNFSFRNAA